MPRRKNTEVRVYVVEYGRDKLMLRIRWPNGTEQHETVETNDRKDAERLAGAREAELRLQGPQPSGRMTWTAFRTHLEQQVIAGHAKSTQAKYATVMNTFERLAKPQTLADITTQLMSKFVADWRLEGTTDATIRGSLGHLGAAFSWAVEQGWLVRPPVIRRPALVDREPTKGRAITDAEFKSMLKATPLVVGKQAKHWQHLLKGLMLSGLRLGEVLRLSWDIAGSIRVDLSGEFPMLHIPGNRQKNRNAELWPMTPDFAALLLATRQSDRTGYVFQVPMPIRFGTEHRRLDTVSKIITEIGEKAEVTVDEERGKFASAHDLRRSFGVRWSEVLMPAELQALMRHASIETTMKFYTRQKSNALAVKIWEKGNLSGNSKAASKPKTAKTSGKK